MTTIRKATAAALTGIATWGITAQPAGIDGAEWWGLFGVLVGAFLVWLVPNETPAPVFRDVLDSDGEPWPDPDEIPTTGSPEAGRSDLGTVVVIALAVIGALVVLSWLIAAL